jgi:hypothetical protein
VPKDVFFKCDWDKWMALGKEVHDRIDKNSIYWSEYYLGSVDKYSYSEEELKSMPNLEFSVGAWTPAWMVAANISTAKRANVNYTWLPAAHYPEVVCPDVLAKYIQTTSEKYL